MFSATLCHMPAIRVPGATGTRPTVIYCLWVLQEAPFDRKGTRIRLVKVGKQITIGSSKALLQLRRRTPDWNMHPQELLLPLILDDDEASSPRERIWGASEDLELRNCDLVLFRSLDAKISACLMVFWLFANKYFYFRQNHMWLTSILSWSASTFVDITRIYLEPKHEHWF